MDVNETQEVKQSEEENRRLKKVAAGLSLDKDALPSVIRKNGWSSQPEGSCRAGAREYAFSERRACRLRYGDVSRNLPVDIGRCAELGLGWARLG
jgi:hypothetical protein